VEFVAGVVQPIHEPAELWVNLFDQASPDDGDEPQVRTVKVHLSLTDEQRLDALREGLQPIEGEQVHRDTSTRGCHG